MAVSKGLEVEAGKDPFGPPTVAEHERAGITPRRGLRDGAQRRLLGHLDEFLEDVRIRGRSSTYVRRLRQRVTILARECSWE